LCGHLPLALSMVGAKLNGKSRSYWPHLIRLLRTTSLAQITARFPGYPYEDLFRAIQVSVESLGQSDRDRYLQLGILLEDMPAPIAILRTVWGVDEGAAIETAERFMSLSLASRYDKNSGVRLHDTQLDYVQANYPDQTALKVIQEAMKLSSDVIARDPLQFASQLVGRLLSHRSVPSIDSLTRLAESFAPRPWIASLFPTLRSPLHALPATTRTALDGVHALASTPDGRRCVSSSSRDGVRVWDGNGQPLARLDDRHAVFSALAMSPDGRWLFAGARDVVKVWDLNTGHQTATLEGHLWYISSLAASSDGRLIASASWDRTVNIWEIESWQLLRTLEGHTAFLHDVALSAAGLAVSACWDGTVGVWDLQTARSIHRLGNHTTSANAVAVTPDGRMAAVASGNGTLVVWDLQEGSRIRSLSGYRGQARAVAISPTGRLAAAACSDASLRIWHLDTGDPIAAFTCDAPQTSCKFLTDTRIVAGDELGLIHWLELKL
jgi:hypothetical protein